MLCPKSKMCLKGGLIGGSIFFVWMCISWMGIGWHQSYMKPIPNEEAISQVLRSMVKEDGLYHLPYNGKGTDMKAWKAKAEAGPMAHMLIFPNGKKCNIAINMFIGFLLSFIVAALATCLLAHTSGLSLKQKVLYVVMVGLVGSLWHILSQWNWWGYPCRYVLINLVDLTIGWSLVGLGLSRFVLKD